MAAYPVIADEAGQSEDAQKSETDAGFFDFSKTLNGIMKPSTDSAKQTQTIITPAKKPQGIVDQVEAINAAKAKSQKPKNAPPTPLKKPSFDNRAAPPTDTAQSDTPQPRAGKQNHLSEISRKNTDLYKQIFTLQEKGEIDSANALINQLTDTRLYGYVLQQRYLHPTAYQSSFAELQEWLEKYGDHPGAKRIYALAERKRPAGNNTRLQDPQTKIQITRRVEPTMVVAKRYASARNRSSAEAQNVRALQKSISAKTRSGQMNAALSELKGTTLLDDIEYDILNARIAAAYLYSGNTTKAFALASKSAARSGLHVPLASWVAGLVSWKRGKYTQAASYFETVGRSNYASGWKRSAGAYWAARSHMRRGDIKSVSTWLRRGAQNPRTFYGLISTRALGEDFDFNWKMPTFTNDNHKTLSSDPRGARAIALAKIGDITKAQAELLRVDPKQNEAMHNALLSFSGYARLPGVSMRLGARPANADKELYHDGALYPIGPWEPKDGFTVNAALVNAIIRQESRFNPEAESPSGAKGLMQLMPATAKSVADSADPDMEDPAINLQLGQRYLSQLLQSSRVDNNLLSLLIAYNAGPGNLSKWKRRWSKVKDPLLFIELMPSGETRSYVEHVLSNYWIYRMREKQPTPTLDAVVAGAPVKYASNGSGGIDTASLK
ncbi:MAG: lytic transglycosylase domain-containing protein [Alphaproteobacteria bacterium]|nr:lytic transglycosylase domain-containing protein [Alphaproteobacteria bacterium]